MHSEPAFRAVAWLAGWNVVHLANASDVCGHVAQQICPAVPQAAQLVPLTGQIF